MLHSSRTQLHQRKEGRRSFSSFKYTLMRTIKSIDQANDSRGTGLTFVVDFNDAIHVLAMILTRSRGTPVCLKMKALTLLL